MSGTEARVVALVAHARHVPLADRERFARRIADARTAGGVILETCHRVEVYTTDGRDRSLEAALPPGAERLEGEAAARHAIALAVGLDSVVIGEDQILHQLRESVAAARRERRLDPTLDRLFTLALRAGRRARSWRQGPPPSLADAAVAAIERRVGSVRGRPLLVVGAGEMARLAARALVASETALTVASRTRDHADALARTVGATSAPFDPGPAIASFGGAIIALRGPWTIAPSTGDALVATVGAVVDLSVPPALPDDLTARLGGRFVSADALASTEPAPAGAGRLPTRLAGLIDATLDEFSAWISGRGPRAVAASLAQRADADRRAELDELWRRLPGVDPDARAAIEGMSEHLTGRLLREPLERLGRDVDGRAERAARELFAL
jgi:glutamyl-tRNA reductase